MGDLLQFGLVMGVVIGMPLTIVFVLPPIAKAVARRIEGHVTPADEELEAMRSELAELRAAVERIPELEERLDFTERALAAPRSAEPAGRRD
jgi:tetrahydromethanopterin S-methyltransferase subunit G